MSYAQGLTHLTRRDLENLLRRLHDGSLRAPLGPVNMHAGGLSYLVEKVAFLSRLDEAGVRAVLVAVIAERRTQERAAEPGAADGAPSV